MAGWNPERKRTKASMWERSSSSTTSPHCWVGKGASPAHRGTCIYLLGVTWDKDPKSPHKLKTALAHLHDRWHGGQGTGSDGPGVQDRQHRLCGRTGQGVGTSFTWFQGVLQIKPTAQKRCEFWETNEPLQSCWACLDCGEKVPTDSKPPSHRSLLPPRSELSLFTHTGTESGIQHPRHPTQNSWGNLKHVARESSFANNIVQKERGQWWGTKRLAVVWYLH